MLQFTYIPDWNQFLTLIEGCCGQVYLRLPDETLCDLKRDSTARRLLPYLHPGEGLTLTVSRREDLSAFLHYMMEAAQCAE